MPRWTSTSSTAGARPRAGEDGKSVERQIQLAREFAKGRGWAVVDKHVFVDESVSGTVPPDKRPGSSRLLAALRPKPPFRALIVMEQSRLSRDTARALD